jgi:4-aminobutyrate aminotransferase
MFKDDAKAVKAIGDVRGRGLMVGVEVVADRSTREPLSPDKCGEIAMKLLDAGIIVTPCGRYGNVFRFMPPLTIPQEYALKATGMMIDILRDY